MSPRSSTPRSPGEWKLYASPLFRRQLASFTARVEALKGQDPAGYTAHPLAKLLRTIEGLILKVIPRNPNAPEFRQGNTLGADNRHWFRAKFHERYRLFYRFSSTHKVIIYAWVSDEASLRKAGSRTDPYEVFGTMLRAGDPPSSLEELLDASTRIEEAETLRPGDKQRNNRARSPGIRSSKRR